MKEMGYGRAPDGITLERYCVRCVQWAKAIAHTNKYGFSYPVKDGDGKVKCFMQFPEVAIANKLDTILLRIEQEFGWTPAARARVRVEDPLPMDSTAARFFADAMN